MVWSVGLSTDGVALTKPMLHSAPQIFAHTLLLSRTQGMVGLYALCLQTLLIFRQFSEFVFGNPLVLRTSDQGTYTVGFVWILFLWLDCSYGFNLLAYLSWFFSMCVYMYGHSEHAHGGQQFVEVISLLLPPPWGFRDGARRWPSWSPDCYKRMISCM